MDQITKQESPREKDIGGQPSVSQQVGDTTLRTSSSNTPLSVSPSDSRENGEPQDLKSEPTEQVAGSTEGEDSAVKSLSTPATESPVVNDEETALAIRKLEEKRMDEKREEKRAHKRVNFDREFRSFIKQSQECIHSRYETSIKLGQTRTELVCLNKYLSIYNNTNPEEHYNYFETTYNKNRFSIIKTPRDDTWLKGKNVVVQFGEGLKMSGGEGMEEKRKQIRLMISSIYNIAVDLQNMAEKSLDGIDESFTKDAAGKDLIRTNILLLHLYRIFFYLNDNPDRDILGPIVNKLEDELGVVNKTSITTPSNNNASTTPLVGDGADNAISGGISGLFNMATGIMKKMGMEPPAGMVAPSEGEINRVISTVFNNQTTKTAIEGMLTSLKDCDNVESAVQQVMKNVTTPELLSSISNTTMEATNSVMNNKEGAPVSGVQHTG